MCHAHRWPAHLLIPKCASALHAFAVIEVLQGSSNFRRFGHFEARRFPLEFWGIGRAKAIACYR